MTTTSTLRDGIQESCAGSDSPASGLTKFLKRSDSPTYVNSTGYTNPSAGWKWWYYAEGCVWSLSMFSCKAVVQTLNEVYDAQDAFMGYLGGVMGLAQLRVLFREGNIIFISVDERMKDLAISMTTVIRTNGGDLTYIPAYAKGTVWINTTCMYIRWPWVSFPVVMIGLTGVFLMLVAFENRGIEHDRLWKSSFLAALFCEVELHDRPIGKKEMRAIAVSTSVSVEEKTGTLRLVAG